MITVGSLFAGIGGIELGLERTGGFKTVWQCEIGDYATRVLEKHWPDVRRWRDVRTFPTEPVEDWKVDLICGGDPCQANSAAGKSTRESLGGEFLRVVDVLRPRLVLRENPSHIRTDAPWPWWRMRTGLESLGYAVLPFKLRACCFGAFHQRERVFLLGEFSNPNGQRLERWKEKAQIREPSKSPRRIHAEDWLAVSASRGLRSRNGFPGYVDRVAAIGNAVYPAVAQWIGERILEATQ